MKTQYVCGLHCFYSSYLSVTLGKLIYSWICSLLKKIDQIPGLQKSYYLYKLSPLWSSFLCDKWLLMQGNRCSSLSRLA